MLLLHYISLSVIHTVPRIVIYVGISDSHHLVLPYLEIVFSKDRTIPHAQILLELEGEGGGTRGIETITPPIKNHEKNISNPDSCKKPLQSTTR